MYLLAYGQDIFFLPKSHIIINVAQKEKIDFLFSNTTNRSIWERNNAHCYESVFPLSIQDGKKKDKIINDLNFFFGLDGEYYPSKEVDSWILKRTNNVTYTSSSINSSQYISLDDFLEVMNNNFNNPPIIDESGLSINERRKYKFVFNKDFIGDFDYVNSVLSVDGLSLIRAKRKTNIFELNELSK